jgi:23S rRNA pseudouridine1911/1915/1917 synthase
MSTHTFPIIFENAHALIIDKPAGVIVHPDDRQEEYTIAHWMKETYALDNVGDEGREGVVHRLDRNTTGVLVLAKDAQTFKSLKRQFHDHTVRKVYHAIVEGNIRHDTGIISLPLARAKSDFRKRTVVDAFAQDTRGEEREAITRYKVLDRTEHEGKHFTYVEVYPLTGRTHQIRAHFRAIRHPIIGDDLYGSRNGKNDANRSMLHAYTITLSLPNDEGKEEEKTVVSPVPQDMLEVLKKLGFSKIA